MKICPELVNTTFKFTLAFRRTTGMNYDNYWQYNKLMISYFVCAGLGYVRCHVFDVKEHSSNNAHSRLITRMEFASYEDFYMICWLKTKNCVLLILYTWQCVPWPAICSNFEDVDNILSIWLVYFSSYVVIVFEMRRNGVRNRWMQKRKLIIMNSLIEVDRITSIYGSCQRCCHCSFNQCQQ